MKKRQLLINAVVVFFILLLGSCSKDDTVITPPKEDVVVEVPKDTIKTPKDTIKNPKDTIADKLAIGIVHRIEVISHFGHLHGKSFHANAQPKESPLKRKQVLVLERTATNVWKQVKKGNDNELEQGKPFIAIGGETYAFEFIYYNKEGKRINSTFSKASKIYQTLFSIDSYKDTKANKEIKTDDGGKSLFNYVYRDTNPEDKMYKRGGVAELSYSNLGLKGYFKLQKGKISFSLNVNLIKFKDIYKKEETPVYVGIDKAMVEEMITFKLPINIIAQRAITDEDTENYFKDLGAFFNLTAGEMQRREWETGVDYESSKYWM